MPQPTPVQGHYDQLLTNLSVAYMQDQSNYIATEIFGQFPVDYQDGIYMRFPRGYFFRDEVALRPLMGEPPIGGFEIDSASYHCDEWAIATALDSRERANATAPYDPERSKVEWLTQQQLIHRDNLWQSAFFKPGVWTFDYSGVNTGPGATNVVRWDQSGSNPIDDIENLKMKMTLSTGHEPNTLVLGRAAFRRLKSNSYIVNRYQYTNPDAMDESGLARILGVDKIKVARSVYNTAVELAPGVTGMNTVQTSDNFVMQFQADPRSALLCYVDPSPGLMKPTSGLTFAWQRLPQAGQTVAPILRDPGPYGGAYFEKFSSRMAYGFQVVAPDLGMFIQNIVDPATN